MIIIGTGNCLYWASYKGKEVNVRSETMYDAQCQAATYFKAKKRYDVNIGLVSVGDKVIIHTPSE